MYTLHRLLLGVVALLLASSIQAESSTLGYLGMGVDRVPLPVRAHLPDEVTDKQGLLVTQFADIAPAADDGIKLYDVLIAYDGQPIEEPEKFIRKVREDKPGRIIKLTLVRQGVVLTVPVTMGEQAAGSVAQVPNVQATPSQYPAPPMPNRPAAQGNTPPTPPGADFDGLAIRKIAENTYDASIGFIGPDGSRQRRSYKGTREQILQQIMNARDLPPKAREQLLFAVKPKKKPTGKSNMPFDPGSFFKGWGF